MEPTASDAAQYCAVTPLFLLHLLYAKKVFLVARVERFSVVDEAGRTVVCLAGELDLANRDELRLSLAPVQGRVVADLTEVSFLDSSIIGVLVSTQKRLKAEGGELRLRNPQDLPRRALEVVGLATWID